MAGLELEELVGNLAETEEVDEEEDGLGKDVEDTV